MGSFGAAEVLLVLIAIIVLFGAKRLPTAARSLGQSMRIFKAETKGLREDDATQIPLQPAAAHVEGAGAADRPAVSPDEPQPRS